MNTRKFALTVTVLLLLLSSAVAVSAAGEITTDCLGGENVGWATVDGNTICFMGQDDLGTGWTTWTYGVRRDEAASGNGLSHITFDLCVDDAGLVIPTNGDTYTTPSAYVDFSGIAGVNYTVVVTPNPDPTTLVGGIKFEDPSVEQLAGEVHIFQFTQPTQLNPGTGPRLIGFKDGNAGAQVWIHGTSAVELTSFRAQSMSLFGRLLQWLGLR